MRYYMLFMMAMIIFTGILVYNQPPSGCYVLFNTSKGENLYRVKAQEVERVFLQEQEDKSQDPIVCHWLFCSYPRVKVTFLSFKDMRQVRVADSLEQAKEKLYVCSWKEKN